MALKSMQLLSIDWARYLELVITPDMGHDGWPSDVALSNIMRVLSLQGVFIKTQN